MDSANYKVQLEIFEGPLDLLLYLIKKEEVDIHEVSLGKITRQYLDYIKTFKVLNIELASEFIVMAANLMYIKSRALLPRQELPPEEDAEEDDPRWDLIRQLIEYKKFKDAAESLSQRELEQADYFAHNPESAKPPPAEPAPLPEASIFDLITAFQRILRRFEASRDIGDIIDDRFTISDKIGSLLNTFTPGQSRDFSSLFQESSSKMEVIVTFLALMELMKLNQFRVRQGNILGKIEVIRNEA